MKKEKKKKYLFKQDFLWPKSAFFLFFNVKIYETKIMKKYAFKDIIQDLLEDLILKMNNSMKLNANENVFK